jgi:hypothetical protein
MGSLSNSFTGKMRTKTEEKDIKRPMFKENASAKKKMAMLEREISRRLENRVT